MEFAINLSELSESELAALWWMVNSFEEREAIQTALAGWFYGDEERAHDYLINFMPARVRQSFRN